MFSNSKPRYFPHVDDPNVLHMGLGRLDIARWIEPDDDLPRYLANQTALREQKAEQVFRALPGSEPAQREFATLLLAHLLHDHGDCYRRDGNSLVVDAMDLRWPLGDSADLWQATQWIADDVCLLEKDSGGEYCLTAASLCAPSQWSLAEKIGRPLAAIHHPIPRFDAEMTPSVSRFFDHLKCDYPVQRFNWSVQPHDRLYWRDESNEPAAADTPLYWRVERQTLRRLPDTDAVVFTIRIYVHPLQLMGERAGALVALRDAIDSCSPDLQLYKNFVRIRAAMDKYL